MKAKVSLIILALIVSLSSSCQSTKNMTEEVIKSKLADFLIKKEGLNDKDIEDIKKGKLGISLLGLFNPFKKNELNDGIYSFSLSRTHVKVYFLIIEKEDYIILDISTREGLDLSLKNTLDFCERKKYCSDITEEYVSRMIIMYYKVNKNPINKIDPNCETEIKDTKNLP